MQFELKINHFEGGMQEVSPVNFTKIHKFVFEISCLQNLIVHKQTDRQTSRPT